LEQTQSTMCLLFLFSNEDFMWQEVCIFSRFNN